MIIQCTRFLKKLYKDYKDGKRTNIPIMNYINNLENNVKKTCSAHTVEQMCTVDTILEAMEVNASAAVISTFEKMEKSKESQKILENDVYALDLLKMGFAHLHVIALTIYRYHSLEKKCKNLKENLDNLCVLYGLTNLKTDLSNLYECGYLKSGATALIDGSIKHMLDKIRPQALNLCEVWGFTDNLLMSAIGNSYGDIYETHLEWAKSSRLNDDKGSIPDGYMEYVMPILQGKL